MTEHLQPLKGNEKYSRRSLLAAAAGTAIALATGHELRAGVRFNAPSLDLETREYENIQLLSEIGDGTFSKSGEKYLFFDPSGEFFVSDRKYGYIHRGGNGIAEIQRAYEVGLNGAGADEVSPLLFDVDISNEHGLHANHGMIHRLELNLGWRSLELYGVVDVNERELRLGRPDTYESAVERVASFRAHGYPFAMSAELKRGEFGRDTLEEIVYIHQVHNVPVVMHSPDSESLMGIGKEFASYHGTVE